MFGRRKESSVAPKPGTFTSTGKIEGMPNCMGTTYNVVDTTGATHTLDRSAMSMLVKGACLGRHQELGAEAGKFACPLSGVTIEEARHPEELQGITPISRIAGPTCKELMMAGAGTLAAQIEEARNA